MTNRSGKLGWFLGIILGALMGVLFAPGKGKDLRDRMKADRKKGKLGIAPLQEDMKVLGREVAALAKDLYESDKVQSLVETGRQKLHDLSEDLVEDINDFHTKRIIPFKEEIESQFGGASGAVKSEKKAVKKSRMSAKTPIKRKRA